MISTHRTFIIAATVISATGVTSGHASSAISDQPAGAFSTQALDGWAERSFKGNTEYELIDEGGIPVLRAHTKGQASVLYREEDIDLSKTPIINWSWKIDRTYENIDEKTKAGDDFPARLYVVVKTGFLPWETVAIDYVWSSDIPVGETWANPFTEKAITVAVQSGDTDVGKWSVHSRNVVEDFKTLFDLDTDEINGYAVMVDGDNSSQDGTAWFGEISFSPIAP
ncbi:DUF3047 domain-containing protein [bacterium]|nr:DUF3047 domain-containing protein [bacterium]